MTPLGDSHVISLTLLGMGLVPESDGPARDGGGWIMAEDMKRRSGETKRHATDPNITINKEELARLRSRAAELEAIEERNNLVALIEEAGEEARFAQDENILDNTERIQSLERWRKRAEETGMGVTPAENMSASALQAVKRHNRVSLDGRAATYAAAGGGGIWGIVELIKMLL